MAWAFWAVLGVAVFCINTVRVQSTKNVLRLTSFTGLLWVTGVAILWLNEHLYPDNPSQKEMGDWLAVIPIALAVPLTFMSIGYFLLGLKRKKEA